MARENAGRRPELPTPVNAVAPFADILTDWKSALLGFLAVLAYTALLRLPFAGNIDGDEVFFVLVAQRWLQDLLPYVSSFDVKPPGLFAVFVAAQAVFGNSIATAKGLETLCVALTAVGLWLIGARHVSSGVGRFAALCYPVYSLALTGVHAPVELVKAPFETFAVLAALEAGRRPTDGWRWVALAGLLMGAATMIKQTAAFAAVALLAALLAQRPRALPAIASFVVGGAVVPGCFVLLFATQGALVPLLNGAVWGAAGRMRGDTLPGDTLSFLDGALNFLPLAKPLLVLMVASVFTLTRGLRLRGGPMAPAVGMALAWFAGEAVGILATRSMYFNYFLALVPSLSLLAGVAVLHLIVWPQVWRRWLVGVVTLLALAYPLLLDGRGISPGEDRTGPAAVARALDAAGLPAAAPILVLDRGLLVYLDAHRPPPGPYFHPHHLMCNFPTPDPDPLAVALAEHPAAIVLADRHRGLICGRPDRFAELSAALAAGYCLAGHVQGEIDAFDLFLARQPGAAPPAACGG